MITYGDSPSISPAPLPFSSRHARLGNPTKSPRCCYGYPTRTPRVAFLFNAHLTYCVA